MTTVPIYDATAPIVCTASGDEVPKRIDQVERMRATLERIERTEHGMLLHFPNRRDIAADLRQFIIDEKNCCQFWGFDVTVTNDELTLRWDAPPAVDDFVERLVAYFKGDEPLTAATGLL